MLKQCRQIHGPEAQKCGDKHVAMATHNLIKGIASVQRGREKLIIFEWADGTDLRKFWMNNEPSQIHNVYEWAFGEMLGIARATHGLHHVGKIKANDNKENIRHGDLKPENIVLSSTRDDKQAIHINHTTDGTSKQGHRLLVADMGISKHRFADTGLRTDPNANLAYGTRMYISPETHATDKSKRLSRLDDTWALGCIFLEFIVWLMRGSRGSRQLLSILKNGAKGYFEMDVVSHRFKIRGDVMSDLNAVKEEYLNNEDAKCQSQCLRELFDFILKRLLIPASTRLHPNNEPNEDILVNTGHTPLVTVTDHSTATGINIPQDHNTRADSEELCTALNEIFEKGKTNHKLMDNDIRFTTTLPDHTDLLSPTTTTNDRHQQCKSNDTSGNGNNIANTLLNEEWTVDVDNMFAERVFARGIHTRDKVPVSEENIELCSRCANIDLGQGGCVIADTYGSLVRNPDTPQDVQRGFPNVLSPGCDTEIKFLLECIDTCNAHECRRQTSIQIPLPTRLLYIGSKSTTTMRIIDTCDASTTLHYAVLSHRWGDISITQAPFQATMGNIASLRREVDLGALPKTFRDAITITQRLGIEYLWIDSLCILQDDVQDWDFEARRMGDVFSGAYITIAATAADHSFAGFLPDNRPSRRMVHIVPKRKDRPSFWVCDHIDDFRMHVEMSNLNKRGWVFQERALSHRTIYFTQSQTYFECGHGVSLKSSFFADPDFPQSASTYYQGMRIRFFQSIYSAYSKLQFSRITDRPVALAGIQSRLAQTFNSRAYYGLVGKHFYRSLLWQRADEVQELPCIDFPGDRRVPSWSWMAVDGEISYLDVPFGEVDWNTLINSPMLGSVDDSSSTPLIRQVSDSVAYGTSDAIISSPSYGLVSTSVLDNSKPEMAYFFLDRPAQLPPAADLRRTIRCVVVATSKLGRGEGGQVCYVLVVAPKSYETEGRFYERIGVGRLYQDELCTLAEGTIQIE
ncbi:heterokaryon incompatibility protein [Ophiostoma piceae UAMH 11346]|uniref:Heterokaryon incompatibility protein n=1 Tax=Ophiostoma piceae (strain UAMH 11346) TaxID=1262450 RepID=S3BQI8_OPHP1|nr:heterokaryon incompatibility protein [Ophiostoma piceae UAMH 11346]